MLQDTVFTYLSQILSLREWHDERRELRYVHLFNHARITSFQRRTM